MAILLIQKPFRLKWALLFVFSFGYGVSAVAVAEEYWSHAAWRAPGKVIVMAGTVTTFPEKSYGKYKWEFECERFRMEEGAWHRTKSKVEVLAPDKEAPPLIGDRLILKGIIRFPRKTEPGEAWMKKNLFRRNIQAQIRVKKMGDVIMEDWDRLFFPLRVIQLAREAALKRLERVYPQEQAVVLKALLLGARLPDQTLRQTFNRTGTSHLLSVSGFHTAVVAGIIFSIVVLCRLNPAPAAFWASLGIAGYMALTGWGVAIQRAGAMAILVWAAWAWGRPQPLVYWLTLALTGIVLSDPLQIRDISFQLSFLSMYGILLITPHLTGLRLPGLDVSVAAFLATYPVVLYHFQTFAWTGIFANLLAVPAFALILPLGLFSLIPGLGVAAVFPVKLILGVTLWMLEKIADWPVSVLILPQPAPVTVGLYYLLGGFWLWLIRHRAVSPSFFVS
jgi:competence protein ComEC